MVRKCEETLDHSLFQETLGTDPLVPMQCNLLRPITTSRSSRTHDNTASMTLSQCATASPMMTEQCSDCIQSVYRVYTERQATLKASTTQQLIGKKRTEAAQQKFRAYTKQFLEAKMQILARQRSIRPSRHQETPSQKLGDWKIGLNHQERQGRQIPQDQSTLGA